MARSKKSKKAVTEGPGHMAEPWDDRKYKVRSAYDTIQRAQEHMADRSLMRDVRKHAKDEMKRAGRIARMEKRDGRV